MEAEGLGSSQSTATSQLLHQTFSAEEGSGERRGRGQGEGTSKPSRSSATTFILPRPPVLDQWIPSPSPVVTARKRVQATMGAKPGTARYRGKTKARDKDKSQFNWPAFPGVSHEQASVESASNNEI